MLKHATNPTDRARIHVLAKKGKKDAAEISKLLGIKEDAVKAVLKKWKPDMEKGVTLISDGGKPNVRKRGGNRKSGAGVAEGEQDFLD